jgi:hypothetical protein
MGEKPNTFVFDNLILNLKSKKAKDDKQKAELYGDLAEEARRLSEYHKQQDPDYRAAFEIKSDGTF